MMIDDDGEYTNRSEGILTRERSGIDLRPFEWCSFGKFEEFTMRTRITDEQIKNPRNTVTNIADETISSIISQLSRYKNNFFNMELYGSKIRIKAIS